MFHQRRTWVYLMRDSRTRFTKIGMSNNPEYREGTLQAENPLIDLVCAWEGGRKDETAMHHLFDDYRLRGEWFDLNWDQMEEISAYFYNAVQYFTGISQAQRDAGRQPVVGLGTAIAHM